MESARGENKTENSQLQTTPSVLLPVPKSPFSIHSDITPVSVPGRAGNVGVKSRVSVYT